MSDLLSGLSAPVVGIGIFVLLVLAAAGGRALRKWQERGPSRKEKESEPSIAQEGYLLGSSLGTLGLLLAFTFGMVLNRFEARRELVTKEANAIGTAYLRAQLLDEPHRTRISGVLVAYADNRIRVASDERGDSDVRKRNDELLTDLWAATRAARESASAHGLTTTLLTANNEVIDLDTERKVAWNLRVPAEVLALLIVYLVVTGVVVGHQVDGVRGRRAALVLFTMVSLSIGVITDLNRPMSGHSRESQEAMLMLLQSLRQQPPSTFDRFSGQVPAAQAVSR